MRQLAPPVEVYDDPADTFVATFLGSPPMNLVPRDGHLVGFRPEHLLPEDVVPGEHKSECRLRWTGSSICRVIDTCTGPCTGLARKRASSPASRLPSRFPWNLAKSTTFAVAADRLRFFDANTGERSEPMPLREG